MCHAEAPFSKHSCKRLLEFEIQVCLEKLPRLKRVKDCIRPRSTCIDISVYVSAVSAREHELTEIFWSSGWKFRKPFNAHLTWQPVLALHYMRVPFLCLESCHCHSRHVLPSVRFLCLAAVGSKTTPPR